MTEELPDIEALLTNAEKEYKDRLRAAIRAALKDRGTDNA
jgi:hypothetical protein